jgi:hypothetical protein
VKCTRANSLASRYVTGKLADKVREDLESHISSCLPCASAFRVRKLLEGALHPQTKEFKRAPLGLRESIWTCMECFERPGHRVCPRLRYKLRLVPPRGDDLQ